MDHTGSAELISMVGLSDTDTNNYDKLLRYKNSLTGQNISVRPESEKTRLRENCNTNDNVVNQLHQMQKRLNNEEIQQIIAGYKSGLTMKELSRRFGCHRVTVSNILKKNGSKFNQ